MVTNQLSPMIGFFFSSLGLLLFWDILWIKATFLFTRETYVIFPIHVWYPYCETKGLVSKYELLLIRNSSSSPKKKQPQTNPEFLLHLWKHQLPLWSLWEDKYEVSQKKTDVNWLVEEHQPMLECFKHCITQPNTIWGKWPVEHIAKHWDFSIPFPEVVRDAVWRSASSTACVSHVFLCFLQL